MMVRFSDIIRIESKKGPNGESEGDTHQKDRLGLGDSQPLKAKEEKKESSKRAIPPKAGSEVVANYYEKFIERAQDTKERVKKDLGISPSPVLSELHKVITRDLVDDIYEYAMSAPDDYDELLIHDIDVTFTSLRVGKGLGYDLKMLLRLGLAAFFQNVGMHKIPESILKRTGKLGKEEVAMIKKHPEISSDILRRMGERYRWLAETALQVHERSDGSGYPLGLKGDEISELASIVGLVDVYVAMIKNRSYRKKFMQTDAIKSILEASKGLFPPKIVKVFLNQISLFPVNSYVRLNNRSIGRVISTEIGQPLRPTIELLYDGLGSKMRERQVIRLSDNPLLYIEGSLDDSELS